MSETTSVEVLEQPIHYVQAESAMARAVAHWQAQDRDEALRYFEFAVSGQPEWENSNWVKAIYSPLVTQSIEQMDVERQKQKTRLTASREESAAFYWHTLPMMLSTDMRSFSLWSPRFNRRVTLLNAKGMAPVNQNGGVIGAICRRTPSLCKRQKVSDRQRRIMSEGNTKKKGNRNVGSISILSWNLLSCQTARNRRSY